MNNNTIYINNFNNEWIFNNMTNINQFATFKKYVNNNFDYIKWTFHRLDIGFIESCNLISKKNSIFTVDIIFDKFYNTNISYNFCEKLLENKNGKLIHDDP
jgi:hypothetical protein